MTDRVPFLEDLGADLHRVAADDEAAIHRRRRRRRAVRFTAPFAAAACLAIVALWPSDRASGLARAYAATAPRGSIVHAVEDISIAVRGEPTVRQTQESYRDATTTRTLTRTDGPLTAETVASAGRVVTYLPTRNVIMAAKVRLLGGDPNVDPVTVFRHQYRAGELTDAGRTTFAGRTVEKATSRVGRERRTWLFDAETLRPVRSTIVIGDPAAPSYAFTCDYRAYDRVPATALTRRSLKLAVHPGAHRATGIPKPADFK